MSRRAASVRNPGDRVDKDFGRPVENPAHQGAKNDLAAAAKCADDDRRVRVSRQEEDWASPHGDPKLRQLVRGKRGDRHCGRHLHNGCPAIVFCQAFYSA
jgi:hypothetical protein